MHRRAERALERLARARRRTALDADPRRLRARAARARARPAGASFTWLRAGPTGGHAGAPRERDARSGTRGLERARAARRRARASGRSGSAGGNARGLVRLREPRQVAHEDRSRVPARPALSPPQPSAKMAGAREHRRAGAASPRKASSRAAARELGREAQEEEHVADALLADAARSAGPSREAGRRGAPGSRRGRHHAARHEPPAVVRPSPRAKRPQREQQAREVLARGGEARHARERLAVRGSAPRPSAARPRGRGRGCCTPRTSRDRPRASGGSRRSPRRCARGCPCRSAEVVVEVGDARVWPRSRRASGASACDGIAARPRDHAEVVRGDRVARVGLEDRAVCGARPRRAFLAGGSGARAARAGPSSVRAPGRRACRGSPCSAGRCRRGRARCGGSVRWRERTSSGGPEGPHAAPSSRNSSRVAPLP